MPSEVSEPTLDELSAYIDGELDPGTMTRIAQHLAGCADCHARVDGLRQTANAVRGLPMESPPRTFTIPSQARKPFRWAPVGWLGGAAAALLVIALGIQNLHLPAGGTTAGTSSYFNAPSTHKAAGGSGAAPLTAPAASLPGEQLDSQARGAFANASTVADLRNGSSRMILGTDGAAFSKNGRMTVNIQLQGSPSTSTNSGDQGLTLTLVRDGVGVALNPVGVTGSNGTPIFGGTYDLGSLHLAEPGTGDYRLEATWVVPDGSGRLLQASVPIRITG